MDISNRASAITPCLSCVNNTIYSETFFSDILGLVKPHPSPVQTDAAVRIFLETQKQSRGIFVPLHRFALVPLLSCKMKGCALLWLCVWEKCTGKQDQEQYKQINFLNIQFNRVGPVDRLAYRYLLSNCIQSM